MASKSTDKQAQERTDKLVEAEDSRKLKQGIERDALGNVSGVYLDRRVADPTSPEAVQVPANTVPPAHDVQLGLAGQDSVTNDDVEALDANNVKIGDVTAESLEVSSKSHNPVSPALERLQEARAELDEHNAAADAERAEQGPEVVTDSACATQSNDVFTPAAHSAFRVACGNGPKTQFCQSSPLGASDPIVSGCSSSQSRATVSQRARTAEVAHPALSTLNSHWSEYPRQPPSA